MQRNIIKRAIRLMWLWLILIFAVTIFFGKTIDISLHKGNFYNFCLLVERNPVALYLVQLLSFLIVNLALWFIMLPRKAISKNRFIIYGFILIGLFIPQAILEYYFVNYTVWISFAFSVLRYIIIPICLGAYIEVTIWVSVCDIIFQAISSFVKSINLINSEDNTVVMIIFMLDYFIMLGLYFSYNYLSKYKSEGKTIWDYGVAGFCQRIKLSWNQSWNALKKIPSKIRYLLSALKPGSMILRIKKTWINWHYLLVYKIAFNLIIFSTIGIFAYFNDKLIEACLLFSAYISMRYLYPKTFHHSKVSWCIFWSIVCFWLTIPMVLPLGISIFSNIVVGGFIGFALWKIQDYIDAKNEIKQLKNKSLTEMSDVEFNQHCRHCGLDETEIIIAELFIRQGLKGKELYDVCGYSERQVKNKRAAIKQKLNIK